jgi:hypothetical protein
MSKKYVPSFLKDQQSTSNTTQKAEKAEKAESATFWPGRPGVTGSTVVNTVAAVINTNSNNKFAALSDDFPINRPVVNTSRPAVEAPKLAPMTLASATSNGAVPMGGASGAVPMGGAGSTGPKKSFASKFAEQAKIANNPNYKPPPKPINFQSEEDFPSLGGKPVNKVITKSEVTATSATGATGTKFADMAKGWAKHKEDEEERARIKAEQEEKRRAEAMLMRSIPIIRGPRRAATKDNYHNEDENQEDSHNYEESSLGDDDSYEVPEGDTEPSDEDDENGEFNSDVGWDGRKRGDLY